MATCLPSISLCFNTLDLGNNFTGELPQTLYSCKSIKALRLANNHLQGQIYSEIVSLESLVFLSISNNNLTNATGALRILMSCNKYLTTLVLSKNFLSEPLPDDESLVKPDGLFNNLQVLALGDCQFKGQVPTWPAKLKNLGVLDLSFNLITGSIPNWLSSRPHLFYIDLSNSHLIGGLPSDLWRISSLTSQESGNQFDTISYLELPIFVKPNNMATNQHYYNQLSNLPQPYISVTTTSMAVIPH